MKDKSQQKKGGRTMDYSFKDVVVEVEKNYTDGEQIMAAAKAVKCGLSRV